MLWALLGDKGSPGVTTTALALCAAAVGQAERDPMAGQVLLVETDPGGGDLECWCGPLGEPGLLAAVTDVRDQASRDRLRGHAVEAVNGVATVVAPTSAVSVGAALQAASPGFGTALAGLDGAVVVDCGRWFPSAPPVLEVLLSEATMALVVCRPTLASVEHTRGLLSTLERTVRRPAAVIVGGTRPYGPDEVSAALGVPVAGVLPWDPRGVAALVEHGASRAYTRSSLGLAVGDLYRSLGDLSHARQVAGRYG